jgi:WD40 repeat protein
LGIRKTYTARVWNAVTGQLLVKLEGHSTYIWSAAFSPDGQRIVTASGSVSYREVLKDNTARVWNAATGQQLAKLEGHTAVVRQARFSPDGQCIVTASNDRTARVYRLLGGFG